MLNLFSNNVEIAEHEILKLADFIYTQTNIKPMSKVIYVISRLLLLSNQCKNIDEALTEYRTLANKLEIERHGADYSLSNILDAASNDFNRIFSTIRRVKDLTQGRDSLGIVFDTLLRGKYEAGEGLGTFLTPEEVVSPSLELCLHFLNQTKIKGNAGDLCGGTGRFIHSIYKKNKDHNIDNFVLADQSAFSIELAKINFHIESVKNVRFYFVTDSITDETLASLNSTFSIIATNPPFGAGKYLWSNKLKNIFAAKFLSEIGFSNASAKIDPAEIFVYRNLLFLMKGGILGIVLPDGVAAGDRLAAGLKFFEKNYDCTIVKLASISLPASTFALGGTVAKTSFVVFKKESPGYKRNGTFHGVVHHIGFLKKGNRRVVDPEGNEYEAISRDIIEGKFKPTVNTKARKSLNGAIPLEEIVVLKREFATNGFKADYHISILDIDETGYIEFRTVLSNAPTTKPFLCKSGDILVSCINPRIWRVTIIPDLPGTWSCSSEFAVLRPLHPADSVAIFMGMLSEEFSRQAILLAKGTSSSRQRIKKETLLTLRINKADRAGEIEGVMMKRINVYKARLAELKVFLGESAGLHKPVFKTAEL